MKNKIIGLTLAGMVLAAGVVSAASMWGTYKGNDIIRLTIDGSPVRVNDVPAINYNSRTMIPISLLGQAGINYTWDQDNKTVDITKPPVVNVTPVNTDEIKAYMREAHMFEEIEDVAKRTDDLYWSYDLEVGHIFANKEADLNAVYTDLQSIISDYNNLLNRFNGDLMLIKQYDVNASTKSNALLNTLYTEIDYYKSAYTALSNYNQSQTDGNWSAYHSSISQAINTSAVYGANKLANESYNIGLSK